MAASLTSASLPASRMKRRSLLLGALLLFLPGAPRLAATAEAAKPRVQFTVIPRYNPLLMVKSYQPIMDYLTEVTPYRFELKLSKSYEEAVDFLRSGVAEFASLGDVTFTEAYDSFGAVPLVRPLNREGRPFYRSIVVVRKDSSIRTLEDLRGRRFAFGALHSTSGNLIPRLLLFKNGIRLTDLAHYENLDKHDAVAKAVLKGLADAGAVKDVIARKYQEHGLRFLAESDPIPAVPIVCRPQTPKPMREAVKAALLGLNPKELSNRKRLAEWDPEFQNGFVEAHVRDYAAIFRAIRSIASTCGSGCHP